MWTERRSLHSRRPHSRRPHHDRSLRVGWLVVLLGLWGIDAQARGPELVAFCPEDPVAVSLAVHRPREEGAPRTVAELGEAPALVSDARYWRPGDGARRVFLVSRSLKVFPGLGSHLFVAIASFPGDSAAEVFSFTRGEGGKVRRSLGQAHRFDWAAWLRLDDDPSPDPRWFKGLNSQVAETPPWVIRKLVDGVVESLDYNLFGTNSNTVAQAVVNRASGDDLRVFERRPFGSLGAGQWQTVEFWFAGTSRVDLCHLPRPTMGPPVLGQQFAGSESLFEEIRPSQDLERLARLRTSPQ